MIAQKPHTDTHPVQTAFSIATFWVTFSGAYVEPWETLSPADVYRFKSDPADSYRYDTPASDSYRYDSEPEDEYRV